MKDFFKQHKKYISEYLQEFLIEQQNQLEKIQEPGWNLYDKLYQFLLNGKMIRGGLVALSYLLFKNQITRDVTKIGGLMELIQSGLLIHDDIMDRDKTRRGKDSLYYQFVKEFENQNINDAYHTGESFGICLGDIAYFFAFQIISQLNISSDRKNSLIAFLTQEISVVGMAQMLDMYWGASSLEIGEEDILKLYCHKTGRYTFSLPLWIGGLLAEQSEDCLALLLDLGQNLGIIFQIKDDELDLFGTQDVTGKPQGSDLREGKQTLFIHYLKQSMDESDAKDFNRVFARDDLSQEDIQFILSLLEKYNIRDKISQMIEQKSDKIKQILNHLDITNPYGEEILHELIDYNVNRRF